MPLVLSVSRPPPTERELEEFEQVLCCRLPADYRRWLLSVGGGRPAERDLDQLRPEEVDVSEFFSIGFRSDVDLVGRNNQMLRIMPKHYIAIGQSLGNDLFVLNLLDGHVGYVPIDVYFGHRYIDENNILTVATNFDELCEKLNSTNSSS